MTNNPTISSTLRALMVLAGISAGIYGVNRLFLIPTWPEIDFLKKYLGDILALPVYLPLSVYLALKLRLVPEDFKLHTLHIVGAGVIFSVLFEGFVPLVDNSSTRDLFDVLAYFAGGLMVYSTVYFLGRKTISTKQD